MSALPQRDLDAPAQVLDEAARLLDGDPVSRLSEEALLRRAFTAHHGIMPHRYRIRSWKRHPG